MADFDVHFEGFHFKGIPIQMYLMTTKDRVVRDAKRDADMMHADEFYISYRGSGRSVGNWVKKGSRWYKEW